jgi:alpha,alpha-trehalase
MRRAAKLAPILSLTSMLVSGGCAQSERAPASAPARAPAANPEVARLLQYIHNGWAKLERAPRDIVRAAADPKVPARKRPIVYVSAREDMGAVAARLRREAGLAVLDQIALTRLPDDLKAAPPGLLYLPYPYVVPGGRFNEMYGWDSYFIVVGLLRDGDAKRARQMVDNHLYEVEHYGTVLNANRSYYLDRSQPPLLGRMVLAVYERTHDRKWLERALPLVAAYHRYFSGPLHRAGDTGLARYHALGSGPAPEVVAGERDSEGRSHYDRVRAFFREHPDVLAEIDPRGGRFYDRAADRLTDEYYVADRSMRESGFDPTDRFGPFGVGILDLAPVCLNALLYQLEQDLAAIATDLGRTAESAEYTAAAQARRAAIDHYLWDADAGLYFDYDFVRGKRRNYPFLTTYLPLWVGAASPAQAARVVQATHDLDRPGGLLTSTNESGNQWDAPFGWAPLELFAVQGMRRFNFADDADRVSTHFLSLVLKEFREHGAVFEKYDVVKRESSVRAGLRFGYQSNEIGFGWTNAVFVELYENLSFAELRKGLGASEAR